jgi:formyl-CoA transferase
MPGMGDHPTAVSTYAAILTALYRRQSTGEGGVVSTSLLANGLWSNSCQIQAALCDIDLIARPPRGERGSLTETYETSDGRTFVLAIANPGREWPILARLLDREEWLDDPLFDTPMARFENAALLTTFLEDIFAAKPWDYWHARLSEANITFGVVARIDDHAADPQVIANGLLPEFVDGLGLRTVDSPFAVEGETKNGPFMAPAIGQHTRQILEEFGISAADIATLMESGS